MIYLALVSIIWAFSFGLIGFTGSSFLQLPVKNVNYINSYISKFYIIIFEAKKLNIKLDIANKCKYPEFIDYCRHYLFEKHNPNILN